MSDPNHFTIEKHPSTTNPNISVISITGIDVTELGTLQPIWNIPIMQHQPILSLKCRANHRYEPKIYLTSFFL